MDINRGPYATAEGEFTDGAPPLTPRSLLASQYVNMVHRELRGIPDQVGIALDEADDTQLIQALILHVETVAALRALPVPPIPAGRTVIIATRGYYSAGDGGGGQFRWQYNNNDVDYGGTVIKPTDVAAGTAGRWLRIENGPVKSAAFGAIGGVVDGTAAMQAYIDYVDSISGAVAYISPGNHTVTNLLGLDGKRMAAIDGAATITVGASLFAVPGIEGTSGHVNLYVDAVTGDNALNCGLSAATPFLTIQQALDFLPTNINHEVVINIADGTYDERGGEDEWGRPVVVDLSKKNVNPLRDTAIPLNTKAAKIVLRGESEVGTIINGAAIGARYGVWAHGTKDVQIEKMTATGCYAGLIAHQGADVTLYDVTTSGNQYGRVIESHSRMEVIRGSNVNNDRNYFVKNGQLQENDSTIRDAVVTDIELRGASYMYLLRVSGGAAAGRTFLDGQGAGMVEFEDCDIDSGATFAVGTVNSLVIRNGVRLHNFTSSVFALDAGYVDSKGTTNHIYNNAFIAFTSKGAQVLNLVGCDSLNDAAVSEPNTAGVRNGGHANSVRLDPAIAITSDDKVLTRPTAGLVFHGTAPPTDANTFYERGAMTLNESAAAGQPSFWICTTRGFGAAAVWTAGVVL